MAIIKLKMLDQTGRTLAASPAGETISLVYTRLLPTGRLGGAGGRWSGTRAVRRFGWSKTERQRQIVAGVHTGNTLDFGEETCYTEDTPGNVENVGEESRTGKSVVNQVRCHWCRGNRQPRLSPVRRMLAG